MQIQKAQARGDFDNLKGKGKPLIFEENPYEPPEMRMALKILKDNDFAPFWIELGKEIDKNWEKLNKELESFKRYTRMILSQKRSSGAVHRYEQKKAVFYMESRGLLTEISHKILDYNLHCPTYRQGRPNIVVDDEMFKVVSSVETLIEELTNTVEKE
ncbi:MAG TPA: DUF1992 domain-containing protein [Syntrophomonadaceae bacterium]|nr:DUF1992 domain-containing protein [Syntrophomonadaceae bacterium]